jgi:hypothetical protein
MMQDDKLNNENLVIIPMPMFDNNDFNRGRDLTFITHNHYGMGNNMMQQNSQQMQMIAMQQALFTTQALLIEQRKSFMKEARQLLETQNNLNPVGAIEDKNNEVKAIAAEYEIVNDEQQKNDEKIIVKENKMDRVDEQEKREIFKSIDKQMSSNNEPPYFLQGSVSGTQEGMIITAPIIFTLRNNIWRDRVRYVMKEYYYDSQTHELKREKNQENNSMVVILFYNAKKEPIELLVIHEISLEDYLDKDNCITYILANNNSVIIRKLLTLIKDTFDLSTLHRCHIIAEPIINNDNAPFLLNNSDNGFLADMIKIKPVLSFGKKEQCISVYTYNKFIYQDIIL